MWNSKIPNSFTKKKQQKESVLQRGLNRVDQGFEQWQKNQESKRLELERQAEMKRQQELDKQRAEQALRKASQKLDRGGYSLWATKTMI